MENFKDNSKRNILLIIIGALIVILIFIYCFWYFNIRGASKEVIEFIGDKNQDIVFAEDIGLNLKEEAIALSLKYSDVTGWLRIPGTSIDEAVFHSTDNDKYLRHDRDRNYAMWGETFLDYRNNINEMHNMKNFIIYGHNTEADSGFTPLLNYQDKDFLNKHKYIEFSTSNKNYIWEIFSVYKSNTEFYYWDTNFENVDEFSNFVSQCKSNSMYSINTNVTKDDTILTLSTCEYSQDEGRLVVQAKLVKNQ